MDADEWLATMFTPALARDWFAYSNDAEILRGQLCALKDCGVLSEDAFTGARDRLEQALTRGRTMGPHVMGISAKRDDDQPARDAVVEPEPGLNLRRVVPIGVPLAVIESMPYVLTSVELWDHQIDLLLAGLPNEELERRLAQHDAEINQWFRDREAGRSGEATLSPPPGPGHNLHQLDLRLRDDLGTEYRMTGGGSGGGRRSQWRIHQTFAPGLPDAAGHLVIELADRDGQVVGRVQVPR